MRQLENTIFRAVVLCDGTTLDVCDFPQIAAAMGVDARERRQIVNAETFPARPPAKISPPAAHSPYALSATAVDGHMRRLADIEAETIRLAIGRYEGRMSEIARRLGIGRSTLYRKLKELGLEHYGEEPVEELHQAAV